MALAPWKIIAMGLIPVAGIGIAYPLVSNYRNKTKIELKTLDDFKKYCLVLAKENGSKQLLTCPVTNNSSETSFYFYKKETSSNGQLPQKIKEIKTGREKITFTLKQDQRKIEISDSKLNQLTNKGLLERCQINWQAKENQKKLTCSNQEISKQLKKFE